ncbi:MAG: sigma 54-interacting transcriptional regulator [Planctomycetes bacterium]|nr:sigma 54-interacting transcriptional regulator [Planctomycetota bacterium]
MADTEGPPAWTALYETEQLISAKSFDLRRTARSCFELGLQISGAEVGFLAILDRGQDLVVQVSKGVDEEAILEEPRLAKLFEQALSEAKILVETSFTGGGPLPLRLANLLVVPLLLKIRPLDDGEQPARERRRYPGSVVRKPIALLFLAAPAGPEPTASLVDLLATTAEHLSEVLVNASLYHDVTRDPLTDLYRRPELERHLAVETRLAQHSDAPVALIMVDIDDLSRINQEHGRARGDKIISRVARLVRAQVREGDACVRYGGEEFAVILPRTGPEGAVATAEKVRLAVQDYPGFGSDVKVQVSVSVAVFPQHADSPERLLRKADQTLFMAKQEGGNRVLMWHRRIPRHALRSDKLLGIITGNQAKDYRNVTLLLDTIVIVNSVLERQQVLSTLLDMMLQLSGCARGILYLEREGVMEADVSLDNRGQEASRDAVCTAVFERVRRQPLALLIHADDDDDDADLAEAARSHGQEVVIALPLVVKGKTIGLLYLDAPERNPELEETDLIFMQALARELGNALEKSRLYQENLEQKDALEELTSRLAQKVQSQASELAVANRNLTELKLRFNYDQIVGKSEPMQRLFKLLDRITNSNVQVLIQGETGTGKELVAQALHYNGPRRDAPFVSINCSAISESLMESELFGHVKGSFTGADRDKPGLFEQADGGTIFLDEVQDMSAAMQRELLRVLQEGEVRRVGGKDVIRVDVRVISATNRDLRQLVQDGQFRQDLFYRLNVVSTDLPPLRDRKEDIPLIVEKLLTKVRTAEGRTIKLSKEALRAILRYDWPGNVRELQNQIEKAALLMEGDTITEEHLRFDGDAVPKTGVSALFDLAYSDAKAAFAREYLKAALARNGGNVTRAAQESGVVRSSFHKMMRKHDVSAKDFTGAPNVLR